MPSAECPALLLFSLPSITAAARTIEGKTRCLLITCMLHSPSQYLSYPSLIPCPTISLDFSSLPFSISPFPCHFITVSHTDYRHRHKLPPTEIARSISLVFAIQFTYGFRFEFINSCTFAHFQHVFGTLSTTSECALCGC